MVPPDLAILRHDFYWHSQNYHHTRAVYLAAINSRRPKQEQQQLLEEWHTAVENLDTALTALLTTLEQAEATPRITQELQRTRQIKELLQNVRELDPIPDEPDTNE